MGKELLTLQTEINRLMLADRPDEWLHRVRLSADGRWYERLHQDDDHEVWLISWLPSQGTQLHDHGGSAGAFTLVQGVLNEAVWSPGAPDATGHRTGRLHHHDHHGGTTVTFDSSHVHDVRNLGSEPAISVHAYSRPLQRMGFYDVTDGSLQLTTVLDTTDPEPES